MNSRTGGTSGDRTPDTGHSRYTVKTVTRFLRAVACVGVLLVGGLPAATLVCQFACATPAEQGHRHTTTHHHGADGAQAAKAMPDSPRLVSAEESCDHAAAEVLALVSDAVRLYAPAAVLVATAEFGLQPRATVGSAVYPADSPPGLRPSVLSLRI